MTDLVRDLRVIAGMISMGERISWGSDSALMEQAADVLERQEQRIQHFMQEIQRLSNQVVDSQNERDSLEAEVEQYKKLFDDATDLTFDECLLLFPQEIAEVRAQAGRDAVVSALRLYGEPSITFSEIDSLADKYANQIRQQAAKGE